MQFYSHIGIPLNEGQDVDDLMFLLLIALFIVFAFVFRSNISLFYKMLKDTWQSKERQNLFEDVSGNEFFFGNFMTFQSITLIAIGVYSIGRLYGLFPYNDLKHVGILLLAIYLAVHIFYLFKRSIYDLLGFVFADKDKFKMWKTNYLAIFHTWGIVLYCPVLWMVFIDKINLIPVLMFVISYILCRIVILYKSFGIFFNKKHGILYISLYLCTLEILPMVMLYQALFYMYNFIEASTLWH